MIANVGPIKDLNDANIEKLRNQMLSRNLYVPDSPYSIDNMKLAESLSSISTVVNSISGMDMSSLTKIIIDETESSPIYNINKKYLLKNIVNGIKSDSLRELSQVFSIGDLFKSSDKISRKDNTITVNNNSTLSKITTVVDRIAGTSLTSTPNLGKDKYGDYISSDGSQIGFISGDYIENSGKGYISLLQKNISRNTYRYKIEADQGFLSIFGGGKVSYDDHYLYSVDTDSAKPTKYNPTSPSTTDAIYNTSTTNSHVKISTDGDIGGIFWGKNGNENETESVGDVHSLLNKTESLIKDGTIKIDQNATVFDFKNIIDKGFNGSPLYTAPEDSLFPNQTNLRQHSRSNRYDTYAKAIRFDGNEVYNGNPNSVINKSVMPKITPYFTSNSAGYDNRNMMFSIENLAIKCKKNQEDPRYGLITTNTGYNINIPGYEVGLNGGRVLWFAPYDIEFQDTTNSNITTNEFIGRSEPLYTWNGAERTGTLSFTLLMDYPEGVDGLDYSSPDFFKNLSEYFAFGKKTNTVNEVINARPREIPPVINSNPNVDVPTNPLAFLFKNNSSTINDTLSILENEYNSAYENDRDYKTYLKNWVTENSRYFTEKELYSGFEISIAGSATKLFAGSDPKAYNEKLASLRANDLKALLLEYLGNINAANNVTISFGSYSYDAMNDAYASYSTIEQVGAINERFAKIIIVPKLKPVNSDVNRNASNDEFNQNESLNSNQYSQGSLYKSKFIARNINDYAANSLESLKRHNFVPTYHSQTPEDMHRRLTFLQQCCRQGESQITDGIFGAKNSAFGLQPFCILRLGDYVHTKMIITSLSCKVKNEMPWDMNPEGMGMMPMGVEISMQIKIIGGQSLEVPISSIQNAISFNYYANSTYYKTGTYKNAYQEMVRELEKTTDNENLQNKYKMYSIDDAFKSKK